MYVVGATQGRAFEDIRKIVPNHFLLVPGIGAQGGSLESMQIWYEQHLWTYCEFLSRNYLCR